MTQMLRECNQVAALVFACKYTNFSETPIIILYFYPLI